MDGASKWQQTRYITLPLLQPTMIVLLLLWIGKLFSGGLGDWSGFYTITNDSGIIYSATDVIDTYVYRSLRKMNDYGMTAAVGLFVAIGYWNDWMTCSLYIETSNLYTLQFLLQSLMNNIPFLQTNAQASRSIMDAVGMLPSESARMATCILSIGPIVLLYPLLQKYFSKGLTIGAVTG